MSEDPDVLDTLRHIEGLLSELKDIAKRGNWETVPDFASELAEKLEWLRSIDRASMNTPSRLALLENIHSQLELNAKSCAVRLEQIKPLIEAFTKKTPTSQDVRPLK